MTSAFVPEYIWQEVLAHEQVRYLLQAAGVPQDQRPDLVRAIIHAAAPKIILANRQRG